MWPTISNINPTIASTIKSYSTDSMRASNLNSWLRVYSGATTNENRGLILQSNTDFKLFSAAGEGNSIYGTTQRSGVIGKDWNGKDVVSIEGRGLRPSPVITSFNSKEGQDQISRTCDFSITCFSLEQLELIQTYFMEPGYSVAVEWGWNTVNSAIGLVKTNSGQAGILKSISDTTLNNGELSKKRISTNGEYDIFLGFIVGSTVSNDGENFKVDVRLRGTPSLPTYLQSHNRTTKTPTDTNPTVDTDKSSNGFGPPDLTNADVAKRRFAAMFNELPSFRQTESVKGIISGSSNVNDYINFDKVITDSIDTFINETTFFIRNETITVKDQKAGDVEIDREKLFSEHRYIRFGLAIDILNKIGSLEEYKIGDKKVSFKLDINNSIIGAFPRMFSTKASKLIITGYVPDFSVYFLSSDEPIQKSDGVIGVNRPLGFSTFVKFVEETNLNEFGLKEKKEYYGYLKNLFVNFDMFKSKIEQKNKTIRDILLDILNEMSSAVNGFWNFQIVEGESTDGNIVITVVDENWIGENPEPDAVVEFEHTGIGSPFLNSTLDISIPSDKANQIIAKRLGSDSQPDSANITLGGLFSAQTDLFLPRSGVSGTSGTSGTSGQNTVADETETQQKLAKAYKERDDLITREVVGADGVVGYYGVVPGEQGERLLKTKAADGTVKYQGFDRALKEIRRIEEEAQKEVKAAAKGRLTTFLDKIDVVPSPLVTTAIKIEESEIKSLINTKLFIYCYDDTDFFNAMKNHYFNKKGGSSLSHPLPIKYTFTILGNSGIRRGDTFKINGIPEKYKKYGIFQVTEVEHSISGMKWETTVTGQYRQIQ
jgi:hypothetical protein